MSLIIAILILGALLTGACFLTWKCGEFLAKHGGKLVNVAMILTVLVLLYAVVGTYWMTLPGIPEMTKIITSLKTSIATI